MTSLRFARFAFWALMLTFIVLYGIIGGIFTPTEASIVASVYALVVGLFVYKGLFGDVEREVKVFSELVSDITFDEQDEIRVSDGIKKLGQGVSLAQTQDIPGYPDLARSVFGRLDADPSDYELYRIRMAYPPMPATVLYRHPMLPKEERG